METQMYRLDILILFLLEQLFNTVIHEWESWAAPPSNQTPSLALTLLTNHTLSLWKACHCSWFKNEGIDSYGIPVICIRLYHCLKAELSSQDRVMLQVEVAEVASAMAATQIPSQPCSLQVSCLEINPYHLGWPGTIGRIIKLTR